MSNKIQVNIADPCHENWERMSSAEKGRYCDACKKQVIDFTNMSDAQLASFFKKGPFQAVDEPSLCGRFYNDQLNRSIEIPTKRIPWIKYFLQLAIPAFLLSVRATAQGNITISGHNNTKGPKDVSPITSCQTGPLHQLTIKSINSMNNSNGALVLASTYPAIKSAPQLRVAIERKITGTIVDGNGQPVPNATVIVKGTKTGTMANAKGQFSLVIKEEWSLGTLEIYSVGYVSRDVRLSDGESQGQIALTASLENVSMGVIVCGSPVRKKQSKPIPLMTQKFMDTAFKFFRIFPNPAVSGTSLHIEWKQTDEGYYKLELIDLSGRNIYSKEIWIDAEARLLTLEIPILAAGNYFLRATNKSSGKNYSEKIVIE